MTPPDPSSNDAPFREPSFREPSSVLLDAGFRERLSAHLDGELPPDEAARVEAELAANPAARAAADEARRVWALLGAYPDEPVPADFAARVRSRAGAPERGPTWRVLVGGKARAILSVAAVLVVVVTTAVLRRSVEPLPDSSATAALEAVPVELLEAENLSALAILSDEEFEAFLASDPDVYADDPSTPSRDGKSRGG